MVNKIPTAQLVIYDGEVAKQKFEASASDFFIPGKKITIEMGYQDGIPPSKKVFEGIKPPVPQRGAKKNSFKSF